MKKISKMYLLLCGVTVSANDQPIEELETKIKKIMKKPDIHGSILTKLNDDFSGQFNQLKHNPTSAAIVLDPDLCETVNEVCSKNGALDIDELMNLLQNENFLNSMAEVLRDIGTNKEIARGVKEVAQVLGVEGLKEATLPVALGFQQMRPLWACLDSARRIFLYDARQSNKITVSENGNDKEMPWDQFSRRWCEAWIGEAVSQNIQPPYTSEYLNAARRFFYATFSFPGKDVCFSNED